MKTTNLYPCAEDKFPAIPGLKFYRTDAKLFYFDATNFLKTSPRKGELRIENFMRVFSYLIESIRDANGIDQSDLLVCDDAGTEYLEECLAIPFLSYVDPTFGCYMVERMEELIRFGCSIDDNMAHFFYKSRFEQ